MSDERLHVLHVDDDENDLFFFARAVRVAELPIVVTEARAAEEALAFLTTCGRPPDLVLLDIRMPTMSGFEFFEELKRTERANVPVVMFSSSEHDTDILRAKDLGAHAYCVKPADLEALVEFVKRLYRAWTRGELPCEWPVNRLAKT